MHIGIVPAREGSVRFPNKNRAVLDGKPLWLIAVEKLSKYMTMVYVNTDDDIILDAAQWHECEPYVRPKKLRDGLSYRIDDVLIEMAMSLGLSSSDCLHLLQPTNPLIKEETILKCVAILNTKRKFDSVQAVTQVSNIYHEYSQRKMISDCILFAHPKARKKCFNSQLKPKRYVFGGYVACRVESLLKHKDIWGKISCPIEVSNLEILDIDTREDLDHVQAILTTGINV